MSRDTEYLGHLTVNAAWSILYSLPVNSSAITCAAYFSAARSRVVSLCLSLFSLDYPTAYVKDMVIVAIGLHLHYSEYHPGLYTIYAVQGHISSPYMPVSCIFEMCTLILF